MCGGGLSVMWVVGEKRESSALPRALSKPRAGLRDKKSLPGLLSLPEARIGAGPACPDVFATHLWELSNDAHI
jgi:hypothetical protein